MNIKRQRNIQNKILKSLHKTKYSSLTIFLISFFLLELYRG